MTAIPSATTQGDVPGVWATPQAQEDARNLRASLRDPERFGVIFDLYFVEIHRYIARRLGGDVADDLAAETFLTAFRKRRRFDGDRGIVRGWLYGIATRHISRYQRSAVRASRALARTPPPPAQDEGHADQVVDRVTAAASVGELSAALAGLSAGDREVLLLVAVGGLSHAEVAGALGIPYGTVGSRLSRARRRLRAALGDTGPAHQEEHDHG